MAIAIHEPHKAMKKNLLLLSCIILINSTFLLSQEVKATWSDKEIYANNQDGYFDSFVGANSKFMFARFANVSRHRSDHLRLVSFDKKTMARVNMVELFEGNKAQASQFKGLSYFKTVVFEDLICVFWTNEKRGKIELYVQSFDSDLAPRASMTKVYDFTFEAKSKKKPAFFVQGNPKIDNHLLIGVELAGNKQESVKFEYKLLNKDLSVANTNTVELPITTIAKSTGLTSSYEYGEDGNIHITSVVQLSKEERKALPKGESSRFPILSLVDPADGKIKSHPLKFENKNTLRSGYTIDKGITKIYAFFCDLEKDPSGKATHGILYGILNNKTMDVDHVGFSYFTKPQLDKLFANDKEDQKKAKSYSKNEKKKKSDDESIMGDYVIEEAQSVAEDLVLFCSRMRNYEVRVCDSKGNCHTNYYCEKRNVTVFRLGKDGKILWASNLDRKITYGGWDIDDVSTIHTATKYYVAYGSQFQIGAEKKNRSARKSRSQMSDRFEYAIFDIKTGDYVKKEYKVNPDNVKKADRKTIQPKDVVVFDNVFYANSTQVSSGSVLIPFICIITMEMVGAVLFFKDFIDNNRNEDKFNTNKSAAASNYAASGGYGPYPNSNDQYVPKHTELYIGVALLASGVAAQFVMPIFAKGSGYVGKIEPGAK
jgi:hypothetical protein